MAEVSLTRSMMTQLRRSVVSVGVCFLWLLVSAWPVIGQTNTSFESFLELKPNVTSLTFSATETAVVLCRASYPPANVGEQQSFVWKNPLNASLSGNFTRSGASSDLELRLTNLSLSDSGVYRCEVAQDNATNSATISILVSEEEARCQFESDTLCGWTTENGSTLPWSLKGCCSNDTASFVNSDHTYGPTTAGGNFMVLQVISRNETQSANLTSPKLSPHNDTKCFAFWYAAADEAMLKISTRTVNTSSTLWETAVDPTNKSKWIQLSVGVPPSQVEYQIELSASINSCSQCPNEVYIVALDDVTLTSGNCDSASAAKTETALKFTPPKSATPADNETSTATNATTLSTAAIIVPTSPTTTTVATTVTPTTKPSTTPTPGLLTTRSTATVAVGSTPAASTSTDSGLSVPTSTSLRTVMPSESNFSMPPPPTDPGSTATRTDGSSQNPVDLLDGTSFRPEESDVDEDDESDAEMNGAGNSAGLAVGIVLSLAAAGACTAAVLYRRKRRGRKSTYITFGNPSYSREHLPANDFTLDSPLTLSSNGYTVLA